MTNVLHNTDAGQRALDALMAIAAGGASVRDGWRAYSLAYAEFRAQHDGDAEFGKAVAAAGLDVWPDGRRSNLERGVIHKAVRAAALWAGSLTEEELAAHEAQYPRVEVTARGGFRGLHTAVLKAAKPKADTAAQEEPELDDEAVEESDGDEDEILSRVAKTMRNALSGVVDDASETQVKAFPDEGLAEFFVTIDGRDYRVNVTELDEDGNTRTMAEYRARLQ